MFSYSKGMLAFSLIFLLLRKTIKIFELLRYFVEMGYRKREREWWW